jgi:single-strand DNA-binding protein
MNDIHVTLTGNVAAPPRQHTFPDGSRVTSLKVASTNRYFDRENQQWRNGETTYFGVRCFRGLADNVAQSVHVGQPIVVHGRLRIREFVHEGERRFMAEVEAGSLGHDLRWGLGSFSKPQRGGTAPSPGTEERSELDRGTQDWALGGAVSPAKDGAPVGEPARALSQEEVRETAGTAAGGGETTAERVREGAAGPAGETAAGSTGSTGFIESTGTTGATEDGGAGGPEPDGAAGGEETGDGAPVPETRSGRLWRAGARMAA